VSQSRPSPSTKTEVLVAGLWRLAEKVTDMQPEVWAYCAACQRWFYWERCQQQEPPACPVCGELSTQLEERPLPA
jgi:NAD-dependent SIR2 family protein deacetylase